MIITVKPSLFDQIYEFLWSIEQVGENTIWGMKSLWGITPVSNISYVGHKIQQLKLQTFISQLTFSLTCWCIYNFLMFSQIEKSRDLNSVDVKSVLLHMRSYRMGLIQTPDQLRFSYLAIIAGGKRILSGSGAGSVNNVLETYMNMSVSRMSITVIYRRTDKVDIW